MTHNTATQRSFPNTANHYQVGYDEHCYFIVKNVEIQGSRYDIRVYKQTAKGNAETVVSRDTVAQIAEFAKRLFDHVQDEATIPQTQLVYRSFPDSPARCQKINLSTQSSEEITGDLLRSAASIHNSLFSRAKRVYCDPSEMLTPEYERYREVKVEEVLPVVEEDEEDEESVYLTPAPSPKARPWSWPQPEITAQVREAQPQVAAGAPQVQTNLTYGQFLDTIKGPGNITLSQLKEAYSYEMPPIQFTHYCSLLVKPHLTGEQDPRKELKDWLQRLWNELYKKMASDVELRGGLDRPAPDVIALAVQQEMNKAMEIPTPGSGGLDKRALMEDLFRNLNIS